MLAQNLKTAAELGISAAELDALFKVLGMLERNEVQHVEVDETVCRSRRGREFPGLFNMGNIWTEAKCGTAACIAGTSDWILGTKFVGKNASLRDGLPDSLRDLFCPTNISFDDWSTITVSEAAIALRNYLTHNDPRWGEALEVRD